MSLIHPTSLSATLNAAHHALLTGQQLSPAAKLELAAWLVQRQGQPGAYADMFAPTARDFADGGQVLTGERVTSRAATAHILGEEACRLLLLLKARDEAVAAALSAATAGMRARLEGNTSGWYCCPTCSCALWRHLSVGGLSDQERLLTAGMARLRERRQGNGRWKGMPYYYTLLTLVGLDLPAATAELRFTAPVVEPLLHRLQSGPPGPIAQRRCLVLQQVLARV